MLRTLQSRFALSHLLPVLLIIPLIGLASIYLIESRFFLDDLASELVVQGSLIAELIQRDQQLWHDPNAADQLITRLQPNMHARLMLLDGSGHMLSSSLASDEGRVGEVITATVVATAMTGTATWQTNDSSGLHERIVDVALPVFDNNSQVIGIVRLSHGMAEIRARLSTMRWVLVVPFIIGIVAAIALALLLARSLALPLIRLRHAMIQWDINQPPQPIPAHGPEQIRALIAQFNGMAGQLYALELGRRRLLAAVVHELGRPVGAIKLATQYLGRYYAEDPALTASMIDDIDEQTDQIQVLLDDLVLLARSAEDHFELALEPVEVVPILTAQLTRFIRKVEDKGIVLVQELAPNLPTLLLDPKRFTQILNNLLDNAGKYTPAGGRVTVSAQVMTSAEKPVLAIAIQDNGPGIAPEEQEKIFQFFYRSPDHAGIHQGIGIGLALARQLAEAQGGVLEVDGSPGRGATFTLRFPLPSSRTQSLNGG
ncbi:MAG: HAMP domain-containing sensor histidine kinase [Caldilineaceae bacterium]